MGTLKQTCMCGTPKQVLELISGTLKQELIIVLMYSWCQLTKHIVHAAGMLLGTDRQLKAIVYTNMLQDPQSRN